MHTFFFFIAAVASGLCVLMSGDPFAKALFTLFTILYIFSLIFDVCAEREQALEDDEDEEEYYANRHYFD
jgi:hypothetical protein